MNHVSTKIVSCLVHNWFQHWWK